MKKNLFILAAAGLALASCSSDETIATSQASNEISFRALTNGMTRAAAKSTWSTGDILDVFAEYKVGSAVPTKYFQANFTKQATGNFTSATSYYWPAMSGNKMTFTAFYGVAQSTTTAGNLTETFTPDDDATDQVDILFARHQKSDAIEAPVPLVFKHMLSQIDVQVKNSNSSLYFNITGVKIGFVNKSGTFSGSDIVADASGKIAKEKWTPTSFGEISNAEKCASYYDETGLSKEITGAQADYSAIGTFSTWMLIPQTQSAFTAYTAKSGGTPSDAPDLNGAYIALQMQVKNGSSSGNVIVDTQWCYWPVGIDWEPGYKYTYQIDVAGGGYQPTDQGNDNTNPDRVLDSPIEISASCTIDSWDTTSPGGNISVGM